MGSQFAEIARTITQAAAIESTWMARRAGQAADRQNTGWMPFQLFTFFSLLAEAVPMIPEPAPDVAPRFLGVGAGPGSKELLARDVFGMDVSGIEIDDEMASSARQSGLQVHTADAAAWNGYGKAEAVWLNRPKRDPADELALERKVMAEMAPGTVLLCANLETRPPESWFIVLDAWDSERYGAWAKPAAASEGWA